MLKLASQTFSFNANGTTYKVYPHMSAILANHEINPLTKKSIAKLTLPQGRKQILSEFIDLYFKQTGKEINPKQIIADLEKAIKAFSEHHQTAETYKKARDQIADVEKDLKEKQLALRNLSKKSHKWAGITLLSCLSVATTQFLGFGYLIFFYSSWEVMEPVTFIVGAFWLMTGLAYYNVRGSDFEYTSVYHAIF